MRTVPMLLFVAALCFISLVVAGCGGDDTVSEPLVPTAGQPVGTAGNVEGFVFVDRAINGITLGRTATPPPGFIPLAGATVDVIDTSVTTTTATDGHFVLEGVEAGLRSLRVTLQSGVTTKFPITVIGGTTILVGTPTISREQAIQIVEQALPPDTIDSTLIMATQQPLPAGVTVAPGMGNRHGEADASLAYTVPTEQWLIYVDGFNDSLFHHPVQFMFVDAGTGEIISRDTLSWPVINGVGFYRNHDINLTSADLARTPTEIPSDLPTISEPVQASIATSSQPATSNLRITRSHVPGCTKPQSYALLIQGGEETAMKNSFNDLKNMLINNQQVPPDNIETITPAERTSPLAEVQEKLGRIKKKLTPCDTLYLFIVAHGFSGGVAVVTKPETFLQSFNLFRDSVTVALNAPAVAEELQDVKACHINVYIDACESGSWIEPLKKVLDPKPGLEATVMTSAKDGKLGVFVRSRVELQRPGLVFTTYYVDNMADLSAQAQGPADPFVGFDAAVDNLRRNASPFPAVVTSQAIVAIYARRALDAGPDSWVRPKRQGETCGGTTPTPTPRPPPVVTPPPPPVTETPPPVVTPPPPPVTETPPPPPPVVTPPPPPATPARPPIVTLLQATLRVPVTTYSVTATDPDGGQLSYQWKMAGEACGTPKVPWTQTGATVQWSHSGNPPDSCAHKGTDHDVVASVTITTSRGVSVQCVISGSETIAIPDPKCL